MLSIPEQERLDVLRAWHLEQAAGLAKLIAIYGPTPDDDGWQELDYIHIGEVS